jgi:excinuclease UvrABC ATPase subunit
VGIGLEYLSLNRETDTLSVDAGLFSFNSKGACESCNGSGVVYTDLAYFAEFKSPCEVCQGRRSFGLKDCFSRQGP